MSQAQPIPEAFSPSVSLYSGRPATTSLEVAKFFGKRHDHVVRSIQDLISNCPVSFSAPNFGAAEYYDEQGKPRPMFIIYRDGFTLLAMSFTGTAALHWKLRYIEAFNAMEKALRENARALASECAWRQGYDEGRASALPDLLAAERAARKEAASAMLALKPRQRVLLKKALRYTAMGLSSREISKLLDCAHREAGQLLSTARKNGLLPLAVKSAVTENHAHLRMVQGRLS